MSKLDAVSKLDTMSKLDLEEIKRLCTQYLPATPAYELAKEIWSQVQPIQRAVISANHSLNGAVSAMDMLEGQIIPAIAAIRAALGLMGDGE